MEKEIMNLFEKEEKEIYTYFTHHISHLKKFAEYVDTGKQMLRERMLDRLSELYLADLHFVGLDSINDYYQSGELTDMAVYAYASVFFEVSLDMSSPKTLRKQHYDLMMSLKQPHTVVIKDNERYRNKEFFKLVKSSDIKQHVNPITPPFVVNFDIDDIPNVEQTFNRVFSVWLSRYENDREMCAAICYGLWMYYSFSALGISF